MKNQNQKHTPPKFARRSMSPIQYINSPTYKLKIKQHDMYVQFGYLKDNKLQKMSSRKRQEIAFKAIGKQKCEENNIDANLGKYNIVEVSQENNYSKNIGNITNTSTNQNISINNNISNYSFDRSILKLDHNDLTNQINILANLQEDSLLLKPEISTQRQHLKASNKILALQQTVSQKTLVIQQQQAQIKFLTQNCSQTANKTSKLQQQIQKLKLLLTLQQRKNAQKDHVIRMLKMQNKGNPTFSSKMHVMKKRKVLIDKQNKQNSEKAKKQNIKNPENVKMQNRQISYIFDNFQLSPDEDS